MFRLALAFLIWFVYRLLTWSWRIQYVEAPELRLHLNSGKGVVFAHWHGHELGLVHLVKPYRIATMVSTSSDGDLMDRVIRLMGGKTVRGSSSRMAVQGLKGLIRLARSGFSVSLAVDGPKGPIHEVKPGVFHLARTAGLPIVPAAVAAKQKKTFARSWNQAFLPLPFSKVVIYFGQPEYLSKTLDEAKAAERLKQQIVSATQNANGLIAD